MNIGQSPLTHASVGTVKSWFLDNPTGLDLVSSCDIVKALFGIPGANPSPIDITDKLCNAAGNIAFRSMLVNKTVKGDIWEFTSDFGLTAIVSKLWHDSTGKFSYGVSVKWNDNQDGRTVCRVRPLVEYTARDIKYFVAEDTTIFTPKEVINDTHTPDAVPDTVPETADRSAGPEEDTGATTDPSVETPEPVDETGSGEDSLSDDRESVTSVEDIEDEEEMEDLDMTVERIKAFAESLVTHLAESGPVTDDKVIAGFRMVFPDSEVTIDRDLSGDTVPENLKVVVKDSGSETTVELKDWDPPEVVSEVPAPLIDSRLSCCVDSGLRVRESNKLLSKAYEILKTGNIKNIVHFEDEINKYVASDKKAEVSLIGDTLHIKVYDRDDDALDQPTPEAEKPAEPETQPEPPQQEVENTVVFPKGSFVSFAEVVNDDTHDIAEGLIALKGLSGDNDHSAIICDDELVAMVWEKRGLVYRVVNDITLKMVTDFSNAAEFMQNLAEEVKEETPAEGSTKVTKVTVVNNSTARAMNSNLEWFRDKLLELIPLHSSVEDVCRAMNSATPAPFKTDVTYDEANESWTVTILDDIVAEVEPDKEEEVQAEEPVNPEEIEEAMSSDKNTTPITVDPNFIDLDDRETRDRVIQVLFPGVTDPAITHLLNFLRDYHTAEETKSFIETKGTFPTETCIVYTNLTFSIVKMKDGRYWRIFCANTDCGLDDPTWLATKYMHGRWHQLGHDISNTTDYVRDNKNGPTWRRKNNNF